VVHRDDLAAVGVELAYDRAYGSFDGRARFEALREAEADDLVLSLAAGARLIPERLQIYGSLPLRFQYRKLHGLDSQQHLALGDATLALRLDVIDGAKGTPELAHPESLLPFLDLFAGMRLKSGRGGDEAATESLVDVTGDGSHMLFGGASVSELVTRDQGFTLSGGYGHRFERSVATPLGRQRFNPGNEVIDRAAFFHNLSLFWSYEFSLAWRSTGSSRYDDVTAAGSDTRRLRAGASLTRTLSFPSWQLMLASAFDPPVRGLGKNLPFAGSTLIFSVRHNFKAR
jgi:hypothetical protein